MTDNIKEATGYVAWCPTGCGWKSNLAVSPEDAQQSLDHHLNEDHREAEPESQGGER